MESEQFKDFAAAMATFISDYLENIRGRRVLSNVEPNYIRPLIPEEAPAKPESWQDVMADLERVIMPGVTHWHSPQFHAYYPSANSYPAIVADMLSDALTGLGFTWISNPASTELEVVMMDWLGKMLDLPPEFLSCTPGGHGGGVIQGTASEATLVALLGARAKTVRLTKAQHPDWSESDIVSKLIGYASEQAHSSVERAGLLGGVQFRLLGVDDHFRLRGDTLKKAVEEDKAKGLIPFYVCATLGTTTICSFDNMEEIGPICAEEKMWLHVDAAYAGSAFICPEFRFHNRGVQYADTFNFNPHKWLLVNFDCSAMWFKDPKDVTEPFKVDALYLRHKYHGQVPDFKNWQIPSGRRFRSLKLWFVLRIMGVEYIQTMIREQVALAHQFEDLVNKDSRFEIVGDVLMGLVCFRLKGSNEVNEKLTARINGDGKIYLVPSKIKDTYFLRFVICSRFTESADVQFAWDVIQRLATELLAAQ